MRDAPGENIEYRMMPPRKECDSTFLWSLKKISGIMIAPFFALTKNTPAPKRCWEVRANRACSHPSKDRENNNVPFDRISPPCWEVRANRAYSHPKNNRENKNVPFDRISPTPFITY